MLIGLSVCCVHRHAHADIKDALKQLTMCYRVVWVETEFHSIRKCQYRIADQCFVLCFWPSHVHTVLCSIISIAISCMASIYRHFFISQTSMQSLTYIYILEMYRVMVYA